MITVSLGASVNTSLHDLDKRVEWFPSNDVESKKDLVFSPDWGDGEVVYLYFAVRDTGRGLSTEEKTRLFHRFSQASPRTHVQVGRSLRMMFAAVTDNHTVWRFRTWTLHIAKTYRTPRGRDWCGIRGWRG